jgi:hypothetical protein
MATTTSITTTYAGEKMQGFISAALLSANTLDAGGITVKPNVKFREVIKVLSTDDILKDASCDFTATSTVTLTERYLDPKEFQVNVQLCKADFRSDWDAISMGLSAHDSLPPSFQDYLVAYMAGKVAEKMEKTIWNGADANEGEFDGLIALATADADVIDVAGASIGAGGVTADNVIDELGKVVDAIPQEIYGKEDLKLYVAPNVARAYVRALGGFGANGLGGSGTGAQGTQWYTNGALSFDGVSIFMSNGIPSNYILAAQTSNLMYGCGVFNDKNEVKVIDLADIDGSQNVRVVMRMAATVNYGIGSEIVLYTPVA